MNPNQPTAPGLSDEEIADLVRRYGHSSYTSPGWTLFTEATIKQLLEAALASVNDREDGEITPPATLVEPGPLYALLHEAKLALIPTRSGASIHVISKIDKLFNQPPQPATAEPASNQAEPQPDAAQPTLDQAGRPMTYWGGMQPAELTDSQGEQPPPVARMKSCSKCHIEKDISEFSKNGLSRDGKAYMCRECHKVINKNRWREMSKSPKFRTQTSWRRMIERCYSETCQVFRHYGGRGISVCDEWRASFEAFYSDMGPRPDGYVIDRIDVNGNYEPKNCRWVTPMESSNNRRNSILLEHNGESKTAKEWASQLGINVQTIYKRIRDGWPVEKIVTKSSLYAEYNAGNTTERVL